MEIDTLDILIDDLARKKAELLSYGSIEIPRYLIPRLSVERAKSGPSSGRSMVGFEFFGRRIKMEVSRDRERFSLAEIDGRFIIRDGDRDFLEVKPLDISTHAPDQIFVSLENRCIYNCMFCRKGKIEIDDDILLRFIRKNIDKKGIRSVAITSGVYPSIERGIKRIKRFVRVLKRDYDDMIVGVESLIKSKDDISTLRSAGTDEIKINIQFPRKDLFEILCGYMDYDKIFDLLEFAVDEFGRGKVTSNIIFGVGERDEEVAGSMDILSEMGVVPNLRMLRLDPIIKRRLDAKLGYRIFKVDPERILRLSILHRNILRKKGLSTRGFKTMCLACGCCDMVPFWDV